MGRPRSIPVRPPARAWPLSRRSRTRCRTGASRGAKARAPQASRFAAVRVHLAHRHSEGAGPGPEVWLLSEWPAGEAAPTKCYLSSLPPKTPLRTLGRLRRAPVAHRARLSRTERGTRVRSLRRTHVEGLPASRRVMRRRPRLPRPAPGAFPPVPRRGHSPPSDGICSPLLRRLPRCPLCGHAPPARIVRAVRGDRQRVAIVLDSRHARRRSPGRPSVQLCVAGSPGPGGPSAARHSHPRGRAAARDVAGLRWPLRPGRSAVDSARAPVARAVAAVVLFDSE